MTKVPIRVTKVRGPWRGGCGYLPRHRAESLGWRLGARLCVPGSPRLVGLWSADAFGQRVRLPGFGSWSPASVSRRSVRSPVAWTLVMPARRVVRAIAVPSFAATAFVARADARWTCQPVLPVACGGHGAGAGRARLGQGHDGPAALVETPSASGSTALGADAPDTEETQAQGGPAVFGVRHGCGVGVSTSGRLAPARSTPAQARRSDAPPRGHRPCPPGASTARLITKNCERRPHPVNSSRCSRPSLSGHRPTTQPLPDPRRPRRSRSSAKHPHRTARAVRGQGRHPVPAGRGRDRHR